MKTRKTDALGLALGVYLECRFRPAAALAIRVTGRDAALISSSEDNLIWQTALQVAADTAQSMPPVELEIDNDIPIGKGLGSSAAALTAIVPLVPTMLLVEVSTTINVAKSGGISCARPVQPRAAIPAIPP